MSNETTRGRRMILGMRWVTRIMGSFLLCLVLLFLIGEGAPNLLAASPAELLRHVALFFIVLPGLVPAWKWEAIGRGMVIGGMALFYVTGYVASGNFPGGRAFPRFYSAGVLLLSSAVSRRMFAQEPST